MTPEQAATHVQRAVNEVSIHGVSDDGFLWLVDWFRTGHNRQGEARAELLTTREGEVAVKLLCRRLVSRGGPAINGLTHLGGLTEVNAAVLRGLVPVISLGEPGKSLEVREATRLCNDDPPPPPDDDP